MTVHPGPRNTLTDVSGLLVGNASDTKVKSGVTVILPSDGRPVAAVSVAGGGPGTRESDALAPGRLVEGIDALVLSGGSAYGLQAASEVAALLGAQGKGFDTGVKPVPIVPSAILFDLANGGDTDWGEDPPFGRLGRKALENVQSEIPLGKVGAGTGARAGSLEGGLGSASAFDVETGATVGALVAVNSFGDTIGPDGRFLAGGFEQNREFGGLGPSTARVALTPAFPKLRLAQATDEQFPTMNTTLAVVATDATLDRTALTRVAKMAEAGLARAIRPIFSPFDGDIVFALATGAGPSLTPVGLARVGAMAADCLARAIARGVYEARSLDGAYPDWQQRFGAG